MKYVIAEEKNKSIIKIGGYDFQIDNNYIFKSRKKLIGWTSLDHKTIKVTKQTFYPEESLPDSTIITAFLHEILHNIDDIYCNGDLPENVIKNLTHGLFQVLMDNKLLDNKIYELLGLNENL